MYAILRNAKYNYNTTTNKINNMRHNIICTNYIVVRIGVTNGCIDLDKVTSIKYVITNKMNSIMKTMPKYCDILCSFWINE